MIENALNEHRQGNLDAAASGYRQVLEAEPDNSDARHLLGLVCQAQGNIDEAFEHVDRAVNLRPDHAPYQQTLGGLHYRRGDLAAARAATQRAVDLDPNLPEGLNTLGFLCYLQGDMDVAEGHLKAALRVRDDSPQVMINLGNVYLEKGRPTDARDMFNQALNVSPDNLGARLSLGRALLAEGADGFAAECFRTCIQANPEHHAARCLLAKADLAGGRLESAEGQIRRVLDARPDHFEALGLAGDVAMLRDNPSQAVVRYRDALISRRGDVRLVEKLGDALLANGDHKGAEHCYQNLKTAGQGSSGLTAKLAEAVDNRGDAQAATQMLEEHLAEQPDLNSTLMLSHLKARGGDRAGALALLAQLGVQDRSTDRVRVAEARMAIADGQPDLALDRLESIAEDSRLYNESLELKGRAHDAQGDYDEAARLFAAAVSAADVPPAHIAQSNYTIEEAASWPREPVQDQRGEPIFLVGLPGSGVDTVAAALTRLPMIEVIADRLTGQSERRDFLNDIDVAERLDELTEDDLRRLRRRYWHGVRHARSRPEEGMAAIEWLPTELLDLPRIARVFPGATIICICREPGDQLLHAETFGWRDHALSTMIDIEDFFEPLVAAGEQLALDIHRISFDRLADGEIDELVGLLEGHEISTVGLAERLKDELESADGLTRHWPAGHWEHYGEALDIDRSWINEWSEKIAL